MKYNLYIRRSKECLDTLYLKENLTAEMFQLCEVMYTTSTKPFLLINSNQKQIGDVNEIVQILKSELNYSANTYQQALNLTSSLKKQFKTIIKGEKIKASDEKIKAREEVCSSCSFKTYIFNQDKCKYCGCFLKIKVTLETEKCPLEKW